jgi:hypothetical protein
MVKDLLRIYDLDLTTLENPMMYVDNVFLILYHHYLMNIAAFPDSRQRI